MKPVILSREVGIVDPYRMARVLKPAHIKALSTLVRNGRVMADNQYWTDLMEDFWTVGFVEKEHVDRRLHYRLTTYGASVAEKMEEHDG